MAIVYLIGGPPRCGKTTAAEMLSRQLHIPWIPADYIEAIVSQYVPEDNQKPYPLTHIRQTMPKSNDRFYTDYSSDDIIKMYRDKAKTVWPGLRAFIEYAVYEKRSFIIEGLHIDPAIVSELLPSRNIACAMLCRLDEKQIEEGFQKSTEAHDWVLEHTKKKDTFPKIAHMISRYSEIIQNDSAAHMIDAICMDNDFNAQLNKVLSKLIKD